MSSTSFDLCGIYLILILEFPTFDPSTHLTFPPWNQTNFSIFCCSFILSLIYSVAPFIPSNCLSWAFVTGRVKRRRPLFVLMIRLQKEQDALRIHLWITSLPIMCHEISSPSSSLTKKRSSVFDPFWRIKYHSHHHGQVKWISTGPKWDCSLLCI